MDVHSFAIFFVVMQGTTKDSPVDKRLMWSAEWGEKARVVHKAGWEGLT